jgi:DNA-directed RNA polymerase subunit RPC12/RpoP
MLMGEYMWIAIALCAVVGILIGLILALSRRRSRSRDHGLSSIRCGGCGSNNAVDFQIVRDKNNNQGYLCLSCRREYASFLKPGSIRCFWMCGACGYRILAGTKIDDSVGPDSRCPNCGADVNGTLVNLRNDRPVASGQFGQPIG